MQVRLQVMVRVLSVPCLPIVLRFASCSARFASSLLRPTFRCSLRVSSCQFLGVPYVAYTLEKFSSERLIVNTRELDCTTLIENVTALTLCAYRRQYTWQAYLDALRDMRYREGKADSYTSRIHYFTEWITANTAKGIVKEIQAPNPPFKAIQTVKVDYMSTHPNSYKALCEHPEYVSDIRRMEQKVSGGKFRYIPKGLVSNSALLKKAVRDGDIIAITCKKKGLDIAHLGLAHRTHDAGAVSAEAPHSHWHQNHQDKQIILNQKE